MAKQETVLFVGTHPDDLEIGCGGTIPTFVRNGFRVVGYIISTDPRRDALTKETAELLGYEPILGGIPSEEVTENLVASLVRDALKQYEPSLVFGHSPKDDHLRHRIVSAGTDSICRGTPNFIHFCGPMRKTEFSPNIFFTFWEEQLQVKLKVLKIMREAYGSTRYFTEEYVRGEAEYLAQRVYQYIDRESAPYIIVHGGKRIPYVEGFEVQRLLDPFFPTSIARNGEYQVPS